MSRTRHRATEQPAPDEAAVVQDIRNALETLGYIVHCIGQRRADLAGTDAGTPDLMVTHSAWRAYAWCGIEVKAGRGSLIRPEQKALANLNRIAVVWTVAQALRAVLAQEHRLGAQQRLLAVIDQLEGGNHTP